MHHFDDSVPRSSVLVAAACDEVALVHAEAWHLSLPVPARTAAVTIARRTPSRSTTYLAIERSILEM